MDFSAPGVADIEASAAAGVSVMAWHEEDRGLASLHPARNCCHDVTVAPATAYHAHTDKLTHSHPLRRAILCAHASSCPSHARGCPESWPDCHYFLSPKYLFLLHWKKRVDWMGACQSRKSMDADSSRKKLQEFESGHVCHPYKSGSSVVH
ncbi:hypothetical protein [Janthinobacterium sp. PSPC3-1]|uniref:hypothetical protein n=1 Tax=Janthinobacterium sp. PSPC3-1 TaxID=2804653 RepID=UPI003CF4F1A8